jgi:adenylate kinase family enzyme
MATPDPLRMVADDVVGNLVLSRLGDEDVRTSGFVLVGYPATSAQAAWLKKRKVWLRHVVHLDLSAKAAEAAITGQLYDPWDGELYHKVTNMPDDEDTRARLVPHPKNSKAVVKEALKAWNAAKPALLKAYATDLATEDATRPQRELVERLAPCLLAL